MLEKGNQRSWTETRERTYELYTCETEESHAAMVRKAKHYGITDARNNRFLLESKKNVRIREEMEDLEDDREEKWRLFNPFLELEGNLFFTFFFPLE